MADKASHAEVTARFAAAAKTRWDEDTLREDILASQKARLNVWLSLSTGNRYPWDYQPLRDASDQYMRNHKDLNVVDKTSRFPPPPVPRKRAD